MEILFRKNGNLYESTNWQLCMDDLGSLENTLIVPLSRHIFYIPVSGRHG